MANPERILGEHAQRILRFWRWLDTLNLLRYRGVAETCYDKQLYLYYEVNKAGMHKYTSTINSAVGAMVSYRQLGFDAEEYTISATLEILGSSILTEFAFLPKFGFATPADLDALPL